MEKNELKELLESVASGNLSVNDAALKFRGEPFSDLGFAKIDTHRGIRQGVAEVIYGEGKTPRQIIDIITALTGSGEERVLITRLSADVADQIKTTHELTYHELARIAVAGGMPSPQREGKIVVAAAGTSDLSVAEEAALTAEFLGNSVVRLYDVGVAGIHRLLVHTQDIMEARVIVAAAGMEGALPSVIAGMASCPVIAVPTSVGYGASFGGVAALLAMLNSCASGVSVVNIDNGFGAGYQAAMINRAGEDA